MTKRPDMQVVGAKIAHLRREKGLCAAAFAREIDQPTWLIMLLESAHMEHSMRLIDLLPDSLIEECLQDIHETFGVGYRWLTTRYQSPKHPPLPEDPPLPEPLMLPIFLTPEDVMAFVDMLTALALPNPHILIQHDKYFLQSIKSVSLLHQLYQAQLRKNGHAELADQRQQQFNQLLDERTAHWQKAFGLTGLDLTGSTTA